MPNHSATMQIPAVNVANLSPHLVQHLFVQSQPQAPTQPQSSPHLPPPPPPQQQQEQGPSSSASQSPPQNNLSDAGGAVGSRHGQGGGHIFEYSAGLTASNQTGQAAVPHGSQVDPWSMGIAANASAASSESAPVATAQSASNVSHSLSSSASAYTAITSSLPQPLPAGLPSGLPAGLPAGHVVLHAPLHALGQQPSQALAQGMDPAEGGHVQVEEPGIQPHIAPPVVPAGLQGGMTAADRVQSNALALDGTSSLQPSITDSIMPAVPAAQVAGGFSQISLSSTSYPSHPTIPTAIGMDALPEGNDVVAPPLTDQVTPEMATALLHVGGVRALAEDDVVDIDDTDPGIKRQRTQPPPPPPPPVVPT